MNPVARWRQQRLRTAANYGQLGGCRRLVQQGQRDTAVVAVLTVGHPARLLISTGRLDVVPVLVLPALLAPLTRRVEEPDLAGHRVDHVVRAIVRRRVAAGLASLAHG